MNCFDLFFIGLFKSHKQSHEFIGRLTMLNQVIFFYFLSIRLSRFYDSYNGFGILTRVIFMFFLIDLFNLIL
jgi:hypothetical protein